MNCKQFERMIPEFTADNLSYKDMNAFLQHMESCSDCKEELTIQVLISEGISRLEEGGAFDLQQELGKRMRESERQIRLHKALKYITVTLGILAAASVLLVFLFLYI